MVCDSVYLVANQEVSSGRVGEASSIFNVSSPLLTLLPELCLLSNQQQHNKWNVLESS